LSRIEEQAFDETGLLEIVIPASVEVFGERLFRWLCIPHLTDI
jgi:hypothetical protein